MLTERLTSGIRLGTLAGATSAGVLVGLGLRHAAALAPFEILGRAFVARWTGTLPESSAVAIALGIVLHFAWMTFWGVCFALFAARIRGLPLLAAAVVFVAFLGALSATVAPGALGAGTMASLTVAQTIFFLALIALAFAVGMRIVRRPA